jgi:uncharacterized protein (DUF302 family)
MLRYLLFFCLLAGVAMAEEITPQVDGSVTTYPSQADFAATRENLKNAVTNQGLLISGEMHLGEMLQRTGPDLGFEQVFAQVESIQFCSALMAHRMIQANPSNLGTCPFSVLIYARSESPDKVYLAFRVPQLAGDESGELAQAIRGMLDTIVSEAASGGW